VLNSAIGAFYYLKILRTMFLEGDDVPEPSTPLALHPMHAGLLLLLAVPNIIGLLLWGYLDRITEYSQKLLEIL
jgi:NADH:ubiquinone oxidoreductase subunit 2 (subunit N)